MDLPREDGKQQCTNCKCWREPTDFIGVKGDIVKRCLKCREKDKRQGKRPEVRERKNALQREKKYYQDYRERKRAENEEEYLAHNAEIASTWRNKNATHWADWRTRNIASRLGSAKSQAQIKKIEWTITDDLAKKIMTDKCEYCDYLETETTLNGINRLDVRGDFTPENVVPACTTCIFVKKCLDPNTLIKRAKHIFSVHYNSLERHPDAWPTLQKSISYKEYQKRAQNKSLPFTLTPEDYTRMKKSPCYYCLGGGKVTNFNGIDRMDNSQGYTPENSVPCCSECNSMKEQLSTQEFIDQCRRIAHHCHKKHWDIEPQILTIYSPPRNNRE